MVVIVQAGLVAGYLVRWAMGKARRVAGSLDGEVDVVLDAGLAKLHDAVAARIGDPQALADLDEEAAAGSVDEQTRQYLEVAVARAARKDPAFDEMVTAIVQQLQEAEKAAGAMVVAGGGARVFTGDARADAKDGGFAFGQIAGDVHVHRGEEPDPSGPGRSRH
jgi:hypothetical protein